MVELNSNPRLLTPSSLFFYYSMFSVSDTEADLGVEGQNSQLVLRRPLRGEWRCFVLTELLLGSEEVVTGTILLHTKRDTILPTLQLLGTQHIPIMVLLAGVCRFCWMERRPLNKELCLSSSCNSVEAGVRI